MLVDILFFKIEQVLNFKSKFPNHCFKGCDMLLGCNNNFFSLIGLGRFVEFKHYTFL